jgi:hypothetical protein
LCKIATHFIPIPDFFDSLNIPYQFTHTHFIDAWFIKCPSAPPVIGAMEDACQAYDASIACIETPYRPPKDAIGTKLMGTSLKI